METTNGDKELVCFQCGIRDCSHYDAEINAEEKFIICPICKSNKDVALISIMIEKLDFTAFFYCSNCKVYKHTRWLNTESYRDFLITNDTHILKFEREGQNGDTNKA